jgi:tryptophanase
MVKPLKSVAMEQRERALVATEYNVFAFPADLLTVDLLSDSGTTTMTTLQWAALIHGDESYGRNTGYYLLLDAMRDTFERGDAPHRRFQMTLAGIEDIEQLMHDLYLREDAGGFVNGGAYQLRRPNAFLTPQGRCAEHLLFSTLAEVIREADPEGCYTIPNNGHFDTTEANIAANGFQPVNLFAENLWVDFPVDQMWHRNPFRGDMDCDRLEVLIQHRGAQYIPLIYLTITNNTVAGQPVSMRNIAQVRQIADRYGIPVFFDACRFAENAWFIQQFEPGYADASIAHIVQRMFSYADGCTISFKKDGLGNIGGALFFRDQGLFQRRFSNRGDIGVRLKQRQILTFGNDSYGGLSGRDIMTIAVGLSQAVRQPYLDQRIGQVRDFAAQLHQAGLPVVLPAGGHAIYLDMDRFFAAGEMPREDFPGVGLCIELIRRYGIRGCELGPFAFEWDRKSPQQRQSILNLVRFALPRNGYGKEHIDYAVAALTDCYRNRQRIPKMRITRGRDLRLRHFQAGLQPVPCSV